MRSYLLSLLLWLEDPLDAVVPPLLPLHWPHCTALHWEHPCTWTCTPSPTSSISETTGQKTNMSQGTSFRHTHVTLSGRAWWPAMPAGMCVCGGDVYALRAGSGLSFARHWGCAQWTYTLIIHSTLYSCHCMARSLSHPQPLLAPSSPQPNPYKPL